MLGCLILLFNEEYEKNYPEMIQQTQILSLLKFPHTKKRFPKRTNKRYLCTHSKANCSFSLKFYLNMVRYVNKVRLAVLCGNHLGFDALDKKFSLSSSAVN